MQRELAGNVPTTLQMRLLFAAGPGAVAELKLRTKHSDGFGIKAALGLTRSTMLAIRALLRQSGRPAPLDRDGDSILLCDDSIHWAEIGSSVCLLRCNSNDAGR
jgi:hypothetical protein